MSCAHFGTRNDKQIVQTDETVRLIREDWYCNVEWTSWNINGEEEVNSGVYFICDGGYICWPELICPYKHEPVTSKKGYFSARVESVRKDVECVFGIVKKRWRILNYGL